MLSAIAILDPRLENQPSFDECVDILKNKLKQLAPPTEQPAKSVSLTGGVISEVIKAALDSIFPVIQAEYSLLQASKMEECNAIIGENAKLKGDIDKLLQESYKIPLLESQKEELKEKEDSLQKQIAQLSLSIFNSEQELEGRITSAKAALESRYGVDAFNYAMNLKEMQLNDTESQAIERNYKIELIQGQYSNLLSQQKEVQERNEQMLEEANSLKDDNEYLKEKNKELETDAESLRAQLQQIKDKEETNEITSINDNLNKAGLLISETNKNVCPLPAINIESQEKMESLQKQLQESEEKAAESLSTYKEQVNSLKEQLSTIASSYESLQNRHQMHVAAQKGRLRAQVSAISNIKSQFEDIKKLYEQQRAVYKGCIDDMQSAILSVETNHHKSMDAHIFEAKKLAEAVALLKNKKEAADNDHQSLQANLNHAQMDLLKAKKEIDSLKVCSTKYNEDLEAEHAAYVSLKSKYERLEESNRQLSEDIARLRQSDLSKSNEIERLNQVQLKLLSDSEALKNKDSPREVLLSGQISKLESQNKDLERINSDAKEANAQKCKALEESNSSLQLKIDSLTKDVSKHCLVIANLNQNIENGAKDLQTLKEQLLSLQASNQEMALKIGQFSTLNIELTNNITKLNEEKANAHTLNAELTSTVNKLNEERANAQTLNTELTSTVNKLNEERANAQKQFASKENEMKTQCETLAEQAKLAYAKEIDSLRDQLNAAMAQNKEQIDNLNSTIQLLQGECKSLTDDKAKLAADCIKLSNESQSLKGQTQQLELSLNGSKAFEGEITKMKEVNDKQIAEVESLQRDIERQKAIISEQQKKSNDQGQVMREMQMKLLQANEQLTAFTRDISTELDSYSAPNAPGPFVLQPSKSNHEIEAQIIEGLTKRLEIAQNCSNIEELSDVLSNMIINLNEKALGSTQNQFRDSDLSKMIEEKNSLQFKMAEIEEQSSELTTKNSKLLDEISRNKKSIMNFISNVPFKK
jgi:chromosome segregation ATPase